MQVHESALLRIHQIIGDRERGIAPLIPISRASWWAGVANGRYPKPVKIGRMTFWRAADVLALVKSL